MNCDICGKELPVLIRKGRRTHYCSDKCKKAGYVRRNNKWISGNWERYFKSLLAVKKEQRQDLTVEILLDILKRQDYKCALTGLELTCTRDHTQRHGTNASIDRINSNLGYNIDNIHLVCTDINVFKRDMTVDEFVDWCKRVVIYALCK